MSRFTFQTGKPVISKAKEEPVTAGVLDEHEEHPEDSNLTHTLREAVESQEEPTKKPAE